MALSKEIPIGGGYTASYWRIAGINYALNGRSTVFMQGFKDKATRDSDEHNTIYTTHEEVEIPKDVMSSDAYGYCYQKLIEQGTFEGAVSV